MKLIDTHAHIYLPEFEQEFNELINIAKEAGVSKILMPAIDSSTHEKMLSLSNDDNCLAMIGLHPCSVNENIDNELKVVNEYLEEQTFIAIGEIGLDFHWDRTYTEQQYMAFEQQIQVAIDNDLPVVIHSRNAIDECIKVIRKYSQSFGVFHCFSGNTEQAKQIIDLGFYLGIGGVVTFKNSGLDKVIADVGLEKVVLETDAPYLAPVPFRGKTNKPAYLKFIAEKLADISNKPVEEVAELTTKNAISLFKLKE